MKIFNIKILTMDSEPIQNGWVEITDGKITAVENGCPSKTDENDIDGDGGTLLPGFIDAHTHLGIIENGISFEGDDCNESTDPFTPQIRAIDGINPFDRCFTEARERGITCVASCPGSANPVGGQIAAIKTYGRRVDDMLIRNVGIKFALGENPKSVYNDKEEAPITRMATAAIIREGLFKAKRYCDEMDSYMQCQDGDTAQPDFDIKNEAMIHVIDGDGRAHFHCHRADDIFTAVRISKEFGLDLTLIHTTEGHLVADILAKEKLIAIVGPVLCDRCKPELSNQELKNAAELNKNGVKIAICTDHPVVPIQYLPISAALCVKGGLPYDDALKAITINAAEAIGTEDRNGSITVGKDADLQLYKKNQNPLDIMAEPQIVMINGKKI